MYSTRYSTTFSLLLAGVSAIASPDNGSNMMKRASLLEGRQGCPTAGWIPACPGLFSCVPPGAICCSDDITYVMPPDVCDAGTYAITTAGVEGPPSTITTPPAAPTQTILNYEYFTFEITWYYWYYYLTYISPATVTTSDQITTVTTVSVQAPDAAQATALFQSLSATLPLPTPAQATTSLNGPPGPASTSLLSSLPSSTAASTAPPSSTTTSSTPVPTSSSASVSSNISTQAATTTAVQFTGGATPLRPGVMSRWAGSEWVMGILFAAPGLLMIWL